MTSSLSRHLGGTLTIAACAALMLTLAACDASDPGLADGPPDDSAIAPLDGATGPSTIELKGTSAASRGRNKVEVCHRTSSDSNEYVLIEIAAPALRAHAAHGDGFPGEAVPTQEGYVFDDACEPAPPELPACLVDAIARINREIPDHPIPTDPATVSPWTLTSEGITEVTYVDDKGTSSGGDDTGYKLHLLHHSDGSAGCAAATLRFGTWGHTNAGSYGYSLQSVSNYFDYLASL